MAQIPKSPSTSCNSTDSSESTNPDELEFGHQLIPQQSYPSRRPSVAIGGGVNGRAGFGDLFSSSVPSRGASLGVTTTERVRLEMEEEELLRDNNLIPEGAKIVKAFIGGSRKVSASHATSTLTETTSLLSAPQSRRTIDEETVAEGAFNPAAKWEESVLAGKIQTTWRREATVLTRYSAPLIVTFLLQYSLTVTSVFAVGHLGKTELAAISLASMTANITGYAVFQGLATALDTLCAQAYGSGKRKQVGLHFLRCSVFFMFVSVPIGIVWFFSPYILMQIVPEERAARLSGTYLRILIIGAPGYALFECGKRFFQAQGMFFAGTLALVICAPANVILTYVLVFNKHIGMGFHGAAIAVVITEWMLPLMLLLYFFVAGGQECWCGFSRKVFQNWWPMIKLALPGLVMIEAEWMSFEILTLGSARFGTPTLAAQSVVITTTAITFQLPLAISIATSTRVANFVGATLGNAAKLSAGVGLQFALLTGVLNAALLAVGGRVIGSAFTDQEDVIEIVDYTLKICAVYQLFDAGGVLLAGILRGQGRQYIGGYINLCAYYLIALPLGFGSAFLLNWQIGGLWAGISTGVFVSMTSQFLVFLFTNWDKVVEEAKTRMLNA